MAVALFDGTRVPESALTGVSDCLEWVNQGQRIIGVGMASAVLVCLEFDASELNPRSLVDPFAKRPGGRGAFKYLRADVDHKRCYMSDLTSTPTLGARGAGVHVFVDNVRGQEGADLLSRLGLKNSAMRRVDWRDIMTMRDTAATRNAVIVMYPVAFVPSHLACSRGPSDPLRAARILHSLPSPRAGT